MEVFLLWHVHELGDGEEDAKLIGVYSSQQLAEAAKERSKKLPGFCDTPDGFQISPFRVDEDDWIEGFTTVLPGQG